MAAASKIRASVIIPWCGEPELAETLQVLGAAPWFEILVVDNRHFSEVKPLDFPIPRLLREEIPGAAAARNRGLAEAQGEFLLFLDADCVPPKGWIEGMVHAMEETAADGMQGPIRSRQTHPVARYIQAEFDQRQKRLAAHGEIALVSTGNCAFRRAVLMEVGFFDTSLAAGEDTELSFRLRSCGHRLRYVSTPEVWHRHPVRIRSLLRRKCWYAFYLAGVYRRFGRRIAENTRTPRTQLLAIGLWVATLPALWFYGWGGGLAVSLLLAATAFPLVLQAGPISFLLFPLGTLMNTIGLLAGFLYSCAKYVPIRR